MNYDDNPRLIDIVALVLWSVLLFVLEWIEDHTEGTTNADIHE